MSAVKAPREFKFVGAFSRKRRRRDGTAPGSIDFVGPTSRPKQTSVSTPQPQHETAAAEPETSPSKSKSPNTSNERREKTVDSAAPPTTQAAEAQAPPLAATPIVSQETANPFDHDMMVSDGINNGSDIDWTYSSLMNPFMDTGPSFMAPFDHVNGQLPAYFGPDLPLIQLVDTPSTDNSPQNNFIGSQLSNEADGATCEFDPNAQSQTIDEHVLTLLNSHAAPSNISDTIAQLLTRCVYTI